MSGFEDREKASENKFAHEEEIKFQIASRKRKLLGIWAANIMELNETQVQKYYIEIVNFGIDNNNINDLIGKIYSDIAKHNKKITENEIKTKHAEFEVIATKQILEELK